MRVSNSSVLIGLSSIDRLELLHLRFPEGVIIPASVWREVIESGHGRAGAEKVAGAQWIIRQQLQNHVLATNLESSLDQGEAEVIALGQEIGADLLLLDEKSVRRVAVRLQYPVLGTVGLLIWGKRRKLFPGLASELSLLREKGGFHLSRIVYEYALQQAGEENV